MALLDVQRRGQQIGRLRIGQQVQVVRDGQPLVKNGQPVMRPARLETFRFTTQSRHGADAIADLYGGTVKEWNGEFEVITSKAEIGVTVPPRDDIVSQWYEMWSKGGCARRCDSRIEQRSGDECLCPHAADPDDLDQVEAAALERARLAKMNPPQACSAITRISVMIPDLPGLGVFRLDTKSYWAAVEIGDAAALMQLARDKGVFLPAVLRIEQRQRIANGQTKKYPVPVLEVLATFREITSGALESGGITAQLPPAPGEQRRALTSGPAAATPTLAAPPQPFQRTPEEIAEHARTVTTRKAIEALAAEAKEARCDEDHVDNGNDLYEPLRDHLTELWRALPAEGSTDGAS
jgi:hypothetical protein